MSTICTLCEEVGHDEERCPTRPCPACGSRTHKSPTHFTSLVNVLNTYAQRAAKKVTIGHNRTNYPTTQCNPRCRACGSSDHRNPSSFACPEHKCTKCKGTLDPKGHNKNNCPEMLNTICTLCEEAGHDEERYPTRPCPACGNRTHKSPTHFECPEHICATCGEKGHNRVHELSN